MRSPKRRWSAVNCRTQKAESLLAEAFTLCTPGRPFLGEQVGASLKIVANVSSNERYKIYELKPSTGQPNFNPTWRTTQTDWACEHQPFSSNDW